VFCACSVARSVAGVVLKQTKYSAALQHAQAWRDAGTFFISFQLCCGCVFGPVRDTCLLCKMAYPKTTCSAILRRCSVRLPLRKPLRKRLPRRVPALRALAAMWSIAMPRRHRGAGRRRQPLPVQPRSSIARCRTETLCRKGLSSARVKRRCSSTLCFMHVCVAEADAVNHSVM
jgi:hypothetical protein